jgi:heme-degrading monooxygenase HmoA
MSVILTLQASGDPRRLEEYANAHADEMRSLADHAKEHGLIAHRFYGSEDGVIMVVDEWPDERSFQEFFDHDRDRIQAVMDGGGMTGDPQLRYWRKLETHDEVGWQDQQTGRFERTASPGS